MRESDPRVIRTKERIEQCFLDLMTKKPVEEITLRELCKAAQCSRNTFYMHFGYKDNLYEQISDEIIADCVEGFRALTSKLSEQTEKTIDQYIENIMNQFSQNGEKLRAIQAGDHNGTFRAKMLERMITASVQFSAQSSGLNTDTDEWKLILHYNIGGIVEFISFWLATPGISLERAKTILRALMDSAMHMGEKFL